MGSRMLADMVTAERLRFTQEAVADALGMSQQNLSKRFRGLSDWKREELVKLAAHLRVPLHVVVNAWMADDPEPGPDDPPGDVEAGGSLAAWETDETIDPEAITQP